MICVYQLTLWSPPRAAHFLRIPRLCSKWHLFKLNFNPYESVQVWYTIGFWLLAYEIACFTNKIFPCKFIPPMGCLTAQIYYLQYLRVFSLWGGKITKKLMSRVMSVLCLYMGCHMRGETYGQISIQQKSSK